MTILQTPIDRSAHFINGGWQPASDGGTFDVINPATEEVVGVVANGTTEDIDRAVAAARTSFDEGHWRSTPPAERAAVIRGAADILEGRFAELVVLITTELGCPRTFSESYFVSSPLLFLRAVADLAEHHHWESERLDGKFRSMIVHQPVGVVGAITPWNGPLANPTIKIGPSLAAGCSIVVKAAPVTPLTGFTVAEALSEAGLPAGVLNYVPGGREAGSHLAGHPGVDKIAFTGSSATGRSVMAACANRIARVSLELGGKSAALMLDDCDAERYVDGVLSLGLKLLNGQSCNALTRLIVPQSRFTEIEDLLTERVRATRVGDPFAPDTEVGPLVSQGQRDRVEGYIATGIAEGAKVTIGGGRPEGCDRGWYVEPTVFSRVDNSMRIAQEEIFGPVVALISYADEADAVRIANDSIYGLGGSVWTDDEEHGQAIAKQMRTGMVHINGYPLAYGTPFGGFKQSGLGREHGVEGLLEYTELQAIAVGPIESGPAVA